MSRVAPTFALAAVCACHPATRDGSGADDGIETVGGEDGDGGAGDDSSDHPAAQCDDDGPGAVVLHRLNRVEYDNTIGDLFGLQVSVADAFPAESHVEGFDNNAQALTVSPLHIEKYLAAAKDVVALALQDPVRRDSIIFCQPVGGDVRACAEPIVAAFVPRAFRRPLSSEDTARLVAVVEDAVAAGDSFDQGVQQMLHAVLLSPDFLYRPEPPPPDADGSFVLPPYALASRLSYFLWSSMPDDELFELAEAGTLGDHDTIASQVRRMLADPKASAFTENFVGQWLHTRAMVDVHPDAGLFADFDDALREAMMQEAYRFFERIVRDDRPVSELLLADFAVVDRRLAQHYGLDSDGLSDGVFEVVAVDPVQRGGVLRQGSFLTVTSHPTRTSPVQRGKWVIEQMLCTTPPPPPPGVEQLPQDVDPGATQREIFEQHRSDPACAACHTLMDPIGFSLENYDAVGRWRTTDNGSTLDTTGELEGHTFANAGELAALLADDPRYRQCLTTKVFTYALGRAPDPGDRCTIEAVADEMHTRGDSLVELLVLVAQSPAATRQQVED